MEWQLWFLVVIFAYFPIHLQIEKKKSEKNPAARLLFESVRWWILYVDFIKTESFCRFSKAIKAILSFCLCICVPLFHENKVLLYCSVLITFSQMNWPFVIKLLKYSSYCSWVRKPSLGKNLQIACSVWPDSWWMLLSSSAQHSWEPAPLLGLEGGNSEGLCGRWVTLWQAKELHHRQRSWNHHDKGKCSIARSVRLKPP